MNRLIDTASTLTQYQKLLLHARYVHVLDEFRARCSYYSWLFHCSRIIVTVGSLLVPALLSVQYSNSTIIQTASIESQVYWITWGISLLVTISNGILTLFKIDKKYYFLNTTYEQLKSEGWQYLELTGRYSGILNKRKRAPTHANQFLYFCYAIEKIKMKQVEEEYFKLSEPTAHAKLCDNQAATPQIQPPNPVANGFSPEPQKRRELPPIDESIYTEKEDMLNTDKLTPPQPSEIESVEPKNTLITMPPIGPTYSDSSTDSKNQFYPPTPHFNPKKKSLRIDISGSLMAGNMPAIGKITPRFIKHNSSPIGLTSPIDISEPSSDYDGHSIHSVDD
jgi:hypothetical protein